MKRVLCLTSVLAVSLFVGCGGSPHEAPVARAAGLDYVDPTGGATDWKLVKDPSSTRTHLVLNLVGPSDGTKYRGVGLTLQADSNLVTFARFKDAQGKPAAYYKDGGVFRDTFSNLWNMDSADLPPTLQGGGVSGNRLMVGIYQKSDDEIWTVSTMGANGATAKDCSGTVLQVAIDFDASLEAQPGSVPFKVHKARAIPEHVDSYLNRKPVDITLLVGTLALK